MLIHVVKSCFNDPTELTGFVPYLRTRLNLPNSPGSHRILRKLLRQLHHATAFPRPIWQRHTSHDPLTTCLYLLEALGIRGREAGARGRENRVENLPSGDPITNRFHRLASTPMPPRATATINVHILCCQVHAVNGTLPGRQQVNGHPWPPTPTQLQQVLFHFRTKPAPYLNKPHIQTTHSTQPTHTGLTTAITTITHMIRTYISCKGSVDTPLTGVDTVFQTLRQNGEEKVKCVDTASSGVDTRPSSQRTQLKQPIEKTSRKIQRHKLQSIGQGLQAFKIFSIQSSTREYI
ncbi:hypothetical protein Taro_044605 [Colocasia esculenta]|uniref:Uncharacterized protein n=1 Tax=Colocasia esculenta TaxID=4460 RepID=A0A843WV01_COLES|nr:hypothetical protein [Colocasia esculenta]